MYDSSDLRNSSERPKRALTGRAGWGYFWEHTPSQAQDAAFGPWRAAVRECRSARTADSFTRANKFRLTMTPAMRLGSLQQFRRCRLARVLLNMACDALGQVERCLDVPAGQDTVQKPDDRRLVRVATMG